MSLFGEVHKTLLQSAQTKLDFLFHLRIAEVFKHVWAERNGRRYSAALLTLAVWICSRIMAVYRQDIDFQSLFRKLGKTRNVYVCLQCVMDSRFWFSALCTQNLTLSNSSVPYWVTSFIVLKTVSLSLWGCTRNRQKQNKNRERNIN